MNLKLLSLVVASALYACNQTENKEHNNVPDNTFDLSIKAYQLSYTGKECVALTNEQDYYFILEQVGALKNEQDYFLDRNKYKESVIRLDSVAYLKNIHQIIFPDSCNTNVIEDWLKRFKEDDKTTSASLRNDTTLKEADQNCLFYKLLGDGFKIYQEDVSGYYNIKK